MSPVSSSPAAHKASVRASSDSPALEQVLTALGDRVAPVSMALERTLPTSPDCAELFVEGSLVRGRVLSCTGLAPTTVALRLAAGVVAAGGWMVVVDVPTLGLDAVSESGVALERVVSVSSGARAGADGCADPEVWADVVAAAADGFDVVVTRVPDDVRAATARKVATRLQQRGVVMIVLGDAGSLTCDGVIESGRQIWGGIGAGWGHLRHRSIDVAAAGRRLPGRRCVTLEFPLDGRPVESPESSRADVEPSVLAGYSNAS